MPKPRKQISEAQRRSIIERYAMGEGFLTLGACFGHSVSVIRRTLTDSGVEIRKQGRPFKAL